MLDRMRREDDGFTLVETLAAMIVFAILAVSVGSVILNGFSLTKSNTARVAAANLAAQAIESARALPARSIPDGLTVLPGTTVNGVPFTMQQTASYVEENSDTSLCTGTGAETGITLAYKLVTVTVSWPGQREPVRQDTLLSLGVGGRDTTTGIAAIGVTGAGGVPSAGVTVTLTPSSLVPVAAVTGADGCAIFTGLAPGSYSAAVGQDGHVTPGGSLSASTTFTVAADAVQRVPLAYQAAGALAMQTLGPEGLLPPPALGMTLSTAGFSPTQQTFPDCVSVSTNPYRCVSGSPRTATRLWPAVYDVQPGPCPETTTSAAQATVRTGQTVSVSLPLAGVRVEVRSQPTAQEPAGPLLSGQTVYAVRAGSGGCPAQSWAMTPAGSSLQSLALPPGTWTLALTADASTAVNAPPWPTATLVAGGPVPTVVVRQP